MRIDMPDRTGNRKETSARKSAAPEKKTRLKTKKAVSGSASTSKAVASAPKKKPASRAGSASSKKTPVSKKAKTQPKRPSAAPKATPGNANVKKAAGSRKPAPAKKQAVSASTTLKSSAKSTGTPAKKTTTRGTAGKKAVAKKPATKKPATKKVVAKRTTTKKPAVEKTVLKRAVPKKAAAKKPAAKKTAPKKAGAKKIAAAIGRVAPPFEPYKGKRPYAFVSYAHKDMREVFRTIGELNRSGFRLWYDEGIEPGNEWPEVVGKALLNSSQVIVFMSPAANNSRNVRNEINLAFSERKELIVILIDETNMSDGMKLQMGSVQQIRYRDFTAAAFMDRLKRFLSPKIKG
jgi:hypothetical protein